MPQRKRPPTRTSIWKPSEVKPFGPHQLAACSASVQALKTRRRGASMTRVRTSSRSAVCWSESVLAATSLLLALQLFQVVLQPVEALFPEDAIVFQPIGGIFQRACFEPARSPLRLAAARDQAGMFEDLEVFRDGGEAHVERFGEFGDRGFTGGEPCQDGPAGGVCQGGERCAEVVGRHRDLTGQLCNFIVKYRIML